MNFVSRSTDSAEATVLVLLPDYPTAGEFATCWWRIADGRVQTSGRDEAWIDETGSPDVALIALAPTSALRFHFFDRPDDATERQARSIARIEALQQSASPEEASHSATSEQVGETGRMITALVGCDRMRNWLDWLASTSRDPVHIVPSAMAVPMGAGPMRAVVGNDGVIADGERLFVDDPALSALLVEPGAELVEVSEEDIEAGLARIADNPSPDLRSGPFVRRRILIQPKALKQLATIVLAIVLVTTATALVEIFRLNWSSDRLDAEALTLAQSVAGNGTTLETAEQAVAARASNASGMGVPLSALLLQLKSEQAVAVTSLGYGDGTTSVTLAGPDRDSINRILLDLQRQGYAVSAVPRDSSDGRKMADITIRIVK